MRSFYDLPAVYDAIHLPDSRIEADGLSAVLRAHRPSFRDLLEPACGTGRYLAHFADRGLRVCGYDINPRALAFARRRLRGKTATVVKASMTDYVRPKSFDAAFSLIGTFRHLLSEKDALRHLKLTARSLRPGGVYVVGLDLVDYADNLPDEEGFEVLQKGRKLQHLYMTLPPDRKKRRERIINFITVDHRVLQDEYDLRSYDAGQWRRLIAASPFRLAGTYTAEGKPVSLDRRTRYALFALKKT
jgi:SAM-dependent methyltransferase